MYTWKYIQDCRNKGSIQQHEGCFSTSKLALNLSKKPAMCYIWSVALCGDEIWTLRDVDEKYLESFEMWCWRRMEKISWTDRARNEEVLHKAVFLNRRAATLYRDLASIIPGRERFPWN